MWSLSIFSKPLHWLRFSMDVLFKETDSRYYGYSSFKLLSRSLDEYFSPLFAQQRYLILMFNVILNLSELINTISYISSLIHYSINYIKVIISPMHLMILLFVALCIIIIFYLLITYYVRYSIWLNNVFISSSGIYSSLKLP